MATATAYWIWEQEQKRKKKAALTVIYDKALYPGHIQPAPFQLEDVPHIVEREWSANWSEMGAYKTSTVLWAVRQWVKKFVDKPNPRVLVVTTRSGKGTYFKHAPDLLPEYELFNLTTNDCYYLMEGHEFAFPYSPELTAPSIFVSHYNVFTKRKVKEKASDIVDKENFKAAGADEMLAEIIAEALAEESEKKKKEPLLQQLQKTHWDIIILDEAHRIKERSTGWTKEIKKLKGTVKHAMTGTGFINDPSEIWSLLNFLDKHEFSSYWRFREAYCAEDIVGGFRRILGINPDTADEFRALVREVGPRRTKREVFKNLPEPIFTPIGIDLSPIQRKMYDEIRDYLYTLDQKGEPVSSPNVLAALQRLRMVCAATPHVVKEWYDPSMEKKRQEITLVEPSSKLDALMEVIEGLEWDEDRRDQVVVFSNFKATIELAKRRFEKKGISYIEMKQSDNDQTRFFKWFRQFPAKNHQVFICTLQLGSESISLTSASTCVFIDRSWSPKDNEQGVSRVWRPGQEEVANIVHINAKKTVDSKVLAKNQMKLRWFAEIFE